MGKILWVVLGVPLGIVLVALGVANRAPITVSLDPFRPGNPALSIEPPLFLAFFVVLTAGVMIGGIAAWLSQAKVRRALYRTRVDLDRMKAERDQLVAERATVASGSVPALTGPRRVA